MLGYGVTGMGDNVALRRFLNDNVVARLERPDGVAQAVLMGGAVQEVQVDVDRAALEASGLSLSQVGQAIGSQTWTSRPDASWSRARSTCCVPSRAFTTLQQWPTLVGIGSTGAPLRVSDIAGVQIGEEDVRNLARVNEGDSVFIMLNKQSGANPPRLPSASRQGRRHQGRARGPARVA